MSQIAQGHAKSDVRNVTVQIGCVHAKSRRAPLNSNMLYNLYEMEERPACQRGILVPPQTKEDEARSDDAKAKETLKFVEM